MAGAAFLAFAVGIVAPELVVAKLGERSITIYNIHTKETVTAVFKRGDRYDPAGLKAINQVMRDHRRDEATDMDPALIDLLWDIHHELGSQAPIHLISGYRSRETNNMLRKTVGGQASQSQHILGKAADVHFPDVPLKKLRYSVMIRERGGVGYYPTSNLPFVHVDTGRVRSWPRLPRAELALLFPAGTTQHRPASGGPISEQDARMAQARYPKLASQVASFHADRGRPKATLAIAQTGPQAAPEAWAPRLIEAPKQVARAALPTRVVPSVSPSQDDRAGLAKLASLASMASVPKLLVEPALAQRAARPMPASLSTADLPRAGSIATPASLVPATRAPSATGQTEKAGRFGWGRAWVAATAYDDEHPDELSYRPFSISPYLTETERQPEIDKLVPHDVAQTLDTLDQPDAASQQFGPKPASLQMAELRFSGAAIQSDQGARPQGSWLSRLGGDVAATAERLLRQAVRSDQR